MYNLFWQRVQSILSASVFGKLLFAIVKVISNSFKCSWLYSFFSSKDMLRTGECSVIPNFIRKFLFDSKLSEFISTSYFVRFFSEFPTYFFSSPVSLLSIYLIVAGSLMFLSVFGNVVQMIILAAVILVGTLLFGIKISIGSALNNSVVFGFISDYFEIKLDERETTNNKKMYLIAVLFGLLSGAASFILGFKLGFIIFAGILFLPYLIASPLLLITLAFLFGIILSSMPAFVFCFLALIVVVARLFCKAEKLPPMRATYILVLLYTVLIAFYTIFGAAGSDSILAGFIQFILISLFFVVTVVVNNYERFKKLIYSLSVCTIYPGLVGVYQFLTGQGGTGWSDQNYVGGLARISSTFANPNVYGSFIIATLCITIVAVLIADTIILRFAFLGCFGLQLVNLALTYSRGCYISALLAILIIIWCCDKRLFGFGIFAIPILPKIIPQNIISRILTVGSYLKDTSVLYRFSIWTGALRIVRNHWYIGSGIGTVAFTLFYQNYMISGTPAEHAHNTFLQIAIELSVLGLILFLMIYLVGLKDVCNVIKKTNIFAKFIVIPMYAAMVGMLVQGFFDYLFYNNIVFMTFWLVVALTVCALNISSTDVKKFAKV